MAKDRIAVTAFLWRVTVATGSDLPSLVRTTPVIVYDCALQKL
ncbi:MAG: hypothetical protein SGI96_12690 [Bacteroidota bacterium]|nr:hypothetical protein [Bacteroidota bacterium]